MSEKSLHHEKFIVTGMTCSACSAHVEKSVRHVDGVCAVSVNLLNGSMVVDYDDTTSPDKIVAAVVEGGYGAELASQSKKEGQRDAMAQRDTKRDMDRAMKSYNRLFLRTQTRRF